MFSKCSNGVRAWVIQRSSVTNTIIEIRQMWCLVCIYDCWFSSVSYEVCLESMKPFSITLEAVARPLCNLAASQKRPYCASMNSHSPVGLVSRQWDAVDWTGLLCDRRIHNDRASRSANLYQCACPFNSFHAGFLFGKPSHHPGLSAPLQLKFGSLRLLFVFSKLKSPLILRRFVNSTVTQYTSSVNGVSLPID